MGETRTGFMLLADISGYTGYLGDSELEHARETLGALLEVLVKGARPPLTFSKLEGDAVFSYTEDSNLLVGQTLVEIVETTYIGFRRAIDLMVLNNTCGCRACTNVATLDLKFFVHHGTFSTLEAGGRVDLVGSDVVVPHRMAKNRIPETTDISAYTAYTDSAIERLGRELIEGMTRVVLEYDDLGEVVVWVSDMHQVWEDKKGEPIIELSDEETALSIDIEIDLPVEVSGTIWPMSSFARCSSGRTARRWWIEGEGGWRRGAPTNAFTDPGLSRRSCWSGARSSGSPPGTASPQLEAGSTWWASTGSALAARGPSSTIAAVPSPGRRCYARSGPP